MIGRALTLPLRENRSSRCSTIDPLPQGGRHGRRRSRCSVGDDGDGMMTTSLPEVISRYLRLAGSARTVDPIDVTGCFTDDAEVTDIDDVRRGGAEIRAWWAGPATAFDYSLEVLGGHPLGVDRYVVFSRLVGDFPGGVADLVNRFTTHDNLITNLEIAATQLNESDDASARS
jgi:hypothetical protein